MSSTDVSNYILMSKIDYLLYPMISINHLTEHHYLKNTFYAYLILGLTDIIHHWHAAVFLNDERAAHAVFIGVLLLPISVSMFILFTRNQGRKYLYTFIFITTLAMLLPGVYHGGWHHCIKILDAIIIDDKISNIHVLFPLNDLNLWFYEITGVLEFVVGVVLAYYLFKYITKAAASNQIKELD